MAKKYLFLILSVPVVALIGACFLALVLIAQVIEAGYLPMTTAFAQPPESYNTLVKPEISLVQEVDTDNLFEEPLVLVTATVVNAENNAAEITAWQYLVLLNEGARDDATCEEAYVKYSDPENPLHFLIDAWKDIGKQMHIQLESSGRDLYYYNNNLQKDIRFYPKQADYGKWMCLRIVSRAGDTYRILKIRAPEDSTPPVVKPEKPPDPPPVKQTQPNQSVARQPEQEDKPADPAETTPAELPQNDENTDVDVKTSEEKVEAPADENNEDTDSGTADKDDNPPTNADSDVNEKRNGWNKIIISLSIGVVLIVVITIFIVKRWRDKRPMRTL